MSDDVKPTPKPDAPKDPKGPIRAEGTVTAADDEQAIYADIAATALDQTSQPLLVTLVERWPRDGGTIVIITCDQDAAGTRARKALATQIAAWEPWMGTKIGDYIDLEKLYGGKPRMVDGVPYIDMPTMTFRLEAWTDPGYKRIE